MKKKIVLASILKPTLDTRMFEKWAVSLARTGAYDVKVIGQGASGNETEIETIGLGVINILSLKRWFASFKVLRITLKVKPQLLVVNTHELLIVGLLNRILFGSKVLYDVQENYYRNILYGGSFPKLLRWPLATWVRLKEKLSASWISWYTLAEAGYQDEMRFFGKRFTVIENKCVIPSGFTRATRPDGVALLFTGTIARSTGVFEAVSLARKLRVHDPRITLTIIGFCAQLQLLEQLKEQIRNEPWITLVGGDRLVPHSEIMDAIARAHFGIISYPPSPHIDNAMPTKLYEYLACELPILLQKHPRWSARCQPYPAAVELDFQHPDTDRIHREMMEKQFYLQPPQHVTWAEEESRLLYLAHSLLQVSI